MLYFFLDAAPNKKVEIPETSFMKPVPGFEAVDFDYCFWLAWSVIIFWFRKFIFCIFFLLTRFIKISINEARRRGEIQHEHSD